MLTKCHIQRKTVSNLPIPHAYSDLAPPCQKKSEIGWLPPPLSPSVADILCERPLTSILEYKWYTHTIMFVFRIFVKQNTVQWSMWFNFSQGGSRRAHRCHTAPCNKFATWGKSTCTVGSIACFRRSWLLRLLHRPLLHPGLAGHFEGWLTIRFTQCIL